MATQPAKIALLDIGGEGRYATALNLNPSATKTLGPDKGQPIPNHIDGRAEKIPLPDQSVWTIIAERTPMRDVAIEEIARIAVDGATMVFRHSVSEFSDPHLRVRQIITGEISVEKANLDGQVLQQITILQAKRRTRTEQIRNTPPARLTE